MQFLVVAVVLACLEGVLGILIALIASLVLAPVIQVPFTFDWQINLLAFVFSAAIGVVFGYFPAKRRSEEHTSELQSLMRISYAVFCLKKKTNRATYCRHTTPRLQRPRTTLSTSPPSCTV